MFNLKKAQAQFVSSFQPKVTVKMIHDNFDSAVDELLNKTLSITEEEIAVRDRLGDAGFWSSLPHQKLSTDAKEFNHKKEAEKNAAYYKQHYPFHKFITRELIVQICKKYGLVFGEASSYKGDIPASNIKEIVSFSLRNEDKIKRICFEETVNDGNGNTQTTWGYRTGEGWFMRVEAGTTEVYEAPRMQIAAPVKDFNTNRTHLSKEDGVSLISLPDPVVFQPVKGGYLIVSKWGDEASDELLINEIEN